MQTIRFETGANSKAICRCHNKCEGKLEFSLGIKENIVGKGENAGQKHFLLSKQGKKKRKSTFKYHGKKIKCFHQAFILAQIIGL